MIVQCHGHFDLLHPGHIRHLQEASRLCWTPKNGMLLKTGDLVVSLTMGKWMSKKGHPIFTDDERREMLLELRCVNHVVLIDSPGSIEAIEQVKPDIYVKGKEYQGKLPEEKYCIDRGIEVRFIGEKIYGSTQLYQQLNELHEQV